MNYLLENRFLSRSIQLAAFLGCFYSIYFILFKGLYVAQLNNVDVTTLLMISILLLRGSWIYRDKSDLVSFSLSLINALSFIYLFEAVYKFLFFSWVVDSAELRELLLQTATWMTIFAGFAFNHFQITSRVKLFFALYGFCMLLWVGVGYPQLFEMPEDVIHILGIEIIGYPKLLNIDLSLTQVYILNRLAKLFLFFSFLFVFKKED